MPNTNPKPSDEIPPAASVKEVASSPSNHPSSNTGGGSRHDEPKSLKVNPNTGDIQSVSASSEGETVPQTAPRQPRKRRKQRQSRAKATSPEMTAFQKKFFFDWLSITIPNATDGKGCRAEGLTGDEEVAAAEATLFTWAVKRNLREQSIKRGAEGFPGACHLGIDPNGDRMATIRIGHKTNMPNLDLPGADGACAELAAAALKDLGPVLLARADVSWDFSKPGLFDELLDYAGTVSAATSMAAPRLIESETGRTFYWGKGEASVKIYQKDLERVAKGKLDAQEADSDLVRVEFSFRPEPERKAGFARVLRDEGPGALLGSVLWVRNMVAHVASITDQAEDTSLSITRIPKTPDPRTIWEKAQHGLRQYARTFCRAAAAQLVHEEFGGDYRAATIAPEVLLDSAVEFVTGALADAAHDVISAQGLDAVREIEEEAARLRQRLQLWIDRQQAETEEARSQLLEYVEDMAALRGDPSEPSSSPEKGGE